jgi:polyadenylate-binding protein
MATETSGLTRTLALHASNLEPSTTEMDLYAFFSEVSIQVASLRIIRDESTKAARYAYVNFFTSEDADKALLTLNYKPFKGLEMLLSRSIPASQRVPAANLYVSALPENTTSQQLDAAFAVFGTIISARITSSPEGVRHSYGYVQFESPECANAALDAVKAGPIAINGVQSTIKAEQFKPSSERPRALATNVFVRNFPIASKDSFEATLAPFGKITSIFFQSNCLNLEKTAPSETGYGFANYSTHEEALNAIAEINKLSVGAFKLQAFQAINKLERQRQVSGSRSSVKANVYVKHIPQTQSVEDLDAFFRSLGEVLSFKLQTNESGARTGVAFVQYRSPEEAQRAISSIVARSWYATIHQPRAQRQENLRRAPVPHFRQRPHYHQRRYPQQQQPQDGQFGMYPYQQQQQRFRQPMYRQDGRYPQQQQQQHPRRRQMHQNNNKPRRAQPSAEEQRQKLGEKLFYKVQEIDSEQTPKITGMLLDMKVEEVEEILKNPKLLAEKVKEAQDILKEPQH